MKCFSISLGCPKNRVDTERLLGSLPEIEMVEDAFEAELVFINTCAFIGPAIQETIQTILAAIEDIKEMPQKPFLAVAGCFSGRFDVKELKAELPEVDLWLEPKTLETWAEQICTKLHLKTIEKSRIISTLPSYAWLKIGEGCTHRCSFCTIPSIRGTHISYKKSFLVEEAKLAANQGVKEIILVAQDITSWKDTENNNSQQDLRPLLEGLISIEELQRIRLMYLYPSGITDDLLAFMASADKKLLPYFDVPLQHAHEDILKQMGRPFAANPYEVVEKIRKHLPSAALRTSLIVGFPGEEEKHYQKLCDFVEDIRFHNMGVFAYQAEEGTKAASMDNQVEDKIKEFRRDNLMMIQSEISEEILENYLGSELELLVDTPNEEWDGLFSARTWFQAPEVDGITYVSINPENEEELQAGQMVKAEIIETKEYDLVALA